MSEHKKYDSKRRYTFFESIDFLQIPSHRFHQFHHSDLFHLSHLSHLFQQFIAKILSQYINQFDFFISPFPLSFRLKISHSLEVLGDQQNGVKPQGLRHISIKYPLNWANLLLILPLRPKKPPISQNCRGELNRAPSRVSFLFLFARCHFAAVLNDSLIFLCVQILIEMVALLGPTLNVGRYFPIRSPCPFFILSLSLSPSPWQCF